MSERPGAAFSVLVAREGPEGLGDQNGEPFAAGAVRTSGIPPLALSPIKHSTLAEESLIVGEATLRRDGSDVFAFGQIWEDMTLGAEVAKMLRHRGRHMGFSLGYRILKVAPPTPEQRELGVKRVLVDVWPVELSAVLYPAQPWAHLLEIKSSCQEIETAFTARVNQRRAALAAINREAERLFRQGRRFLRRVA